MRYTLLLFLFIFPQIISADTVHISNGKLFNCTLMQSTSNSVPAGALADDSGHYLNDDAGHYLVGQ